MDAPLSPSDSDIPVEPADVAARADEPEADTPYDVGLKLVMAVPDASYFYSPLTRATWRVPHYVDDAA